MQQLPLTPFYFLRHGETEWNRKRIYMGNQDIPLNETGRDQAQKAALLLQKIHIEGLFSSPLARALETAHIINTHKGVPLTTLEGLRECRLGRLEGLPHQECAMRWMEGEDSLQDGAETPDAFEERVVQGMRQALGEKGPVLVVAHGGVYQAMTRSMRWPARNLGNCEIIVHQPPPQQDLPWQVFSLSEEKGDIYE